MMRILTAVLALLILLAPDAAFAGPVFFAVLSAGGGVFAAFSATAVGTFLTGTIAGRLLATVALSALQAALAPKPRPPGIQTEVTTAGGTNPSTFILGTYATSGNAVAPPMSHGSAGRTPNAYLTYVIDLGDVAGQTLRRIVVDGTYVAIGATATSDYGRPLLGELEDYAWVTFRDGTQTTADATLMSKYSGYPERPWASDMIGTGVPQAIVTFRYNTEKFTGLPELRFECGGIPVYDPRLDTSVGGSGAHRWATRSTWSASDNPMVLIYNILRGIPLPGLGVWGGGIEAADLPLAAWFAAMNECDVAVSLAAGGTEPAFRAGYEVRVDQTPAEVIEALLAACNGQLAEVGGVWKPRVGGPGLPVMFFSDDDIVVSRSQEFRPFPGFEDRFNGATASYPDPEALWETKEAPPLYNAVWEAEDGGRRLERALALPAAPYPAQVQRLMRADIAEARRFAEHSLVLPPDAAILEPLDAVSWTSTRNGYTAKGFECFEVADDQTRLLQALVIRERDAADHVWTTDDELPWSVASTVTVLPEAQTLEDFAVAGHEIEDAAGNARRPAIRATWDGADQDGVDGVEIEVRLSGGAVVTTWTSPDVAIGEAILSAGLVDDEAYEVRGRPVIDSPADWTAWLAVTTPATRLGQIDLDGRVVKGVVIGPVNIPATVGHVFLTIATGPIDPHQIWTAGVSAELKHTFSTAVLAFEYRFKFAGSWEAWIEAGTLTTTTTWDVDGVRSGFAGQYEDVEYRLVVKTNPTSITNGLRNVYMTAFNVVRT